MSESVVVNRDLYVLQLAVIEAAKELGEMTGTDTMEFSDVFWQLRSAVAALGAEGQE